MKWTNVTRNIPPEEKQQNESVNATHLAHIRFDHALDNYTPRIGTTGMLHLRDER
jgi:hypothetical protein